MRNLILVLFLMLTTFTQVKENQIEFTGNLNIDSRIIADNFQKQSREEIILAENRKSPFLAGLLSLALPGAGEFYNGDYLKSALFLAVEAAAITVGIIYDGKGDDKTEFYQNYADENWSVKKYAEWTIDNANRINSQVDPSNYNVFNNDGSVNWSELNSLENAIGSWFSHRLAPLGDQQYYEMIGKYQQFNSGWKDFQDTEENPYTYGDPLTEMFHYYSDQRGQANEFYNVARWAVIGVVTNHILSAVDAAWSAAVYNSELESQLNIKQQQIGFFTEYYPELSIRLSF